jgi:hypothetical protein
MGYVDKELFLIFLSFDNPKKDRMMVKCVPYSALTRSPTKGQACVQILEAPLHDLLRSIITSVEVDEAWYRKEYGDVDHAIKNGTLSSAQDHYIRVGYFEGRLPRQYVVDQDWYLKTYADVKEAIKTGHFRSAQEHFDRDGYKEGRLPFDGWTLQNLLRSNIAIDR